MKQVFCIGEALIDFICKDIDVLLNKGVNFVKKAGGAPANVAAAIVKLGGSASFCGKVGDDAFGKFLIDEMESHGIDCSHVVTDKCNATTLAFVSLQADGERDFEFVRGADGALNATEIDHGIFDSYEIFHFGSATGLLDGSFKEVYLNLLKEAKNQGKFVSFDPNYRDLLWKHEDETFIQRVKDSLPYVDLIKMSEEEAKLIFGTSDKEELARIVHIYGISCLTITCGGSGTYVSVDGVIQEQISSIPITSIDSTGAGDAFIGALLYKLSDQESPKRILRDSMSIRSFIEFANRVGAITCTKLGAMEAAPTLYEVNNFK